MLEEVPDWRVGSQPERARKWKREPERVQSARDAKRDPERPEGQRLPH